MKEAVELNQTIGELRRDNVYVRACVGMCQEGEED